MKRKATQALNACKVSLLASAVTLALSSQVHAVEFELGDVTVNFDSTFSFGTSYRVEDRDFDLIGKNNHPRFNWQGYSLSNPIYTNRDIWPQAGAFSANGDLGNLNHDPGDAFSTLFKGTHELDINAGDFGFFTRFMYFYDDAAQGKKAWSNPLTGTTYDICADPEAKEQVCQDFRLLDAFVYADFTIGDDIPVSVRLGDQVVSWGESTLISHGINSINPVDIARLKAPGAELKEAFIPVGMLWASLGLTDSVSLDFFYQYEWKKTILPAPGSYFSTNDFAGDGGYQNNVQLGFTQNPDMNAAYVASVINGLAQVAPQSLPSALIGLARSVAVVGNNTDVEPDDGGQYGLKLSIYSEDLNDTEFSFYHMNYHSRRPLISGRASNFGSQSITEDVQTVLTKGVKADALHELDVFTQAILEYPEDIKLYGFSFNTSIGETALAGEIAYRQDEPLQIDDVELLYAGMPEQLANAGLPGAESLAGISQIEGTQPGDIARGYLLFDTTQIQATVTHLFGPTLGADSLALLGEAGYVMIDDFPDTLDIHLNGPGTSRIGVDDFKQGLRADLAGGEETNPFPTESAWGYRMVGKLTYNNVAGMFNVSPRVIFSHDVKGITPDPMFLFVEDRKSASFGVSAEYQNKITADLSYNAFWGGVGTTNNFADRDYVSFSIKYSI
ncbi:DUF1302 domain-containing protein [Saccharobesus litoralis]|uniref:DUF1302 domain-containing protein n=1 Tax=Saccharobesus litoralis TaxID=2172099 RepID=A0A2S0VTX2_9ALTE|nr:DUF1302 domain-containing protein [Saccharobesus litoralis]AWB67666.1 DUF1302 domain-containing protein [Saccharobesus litoralis]